MIILLISSALIFLTKNIYKAKSNTHHFRVSSGYISNVKGGLHGFHIVKYQQLPSIYFELMATCLLNMKINGFVVHRSLMLALRGRLHFHTEKRFLHWSLKELTNCYFQDFYTHLMPLASFYTPWKHYKTNDFMFSGGIEKNSWHEIV